MVSLYITALSSKIVVKCFNRAKADTAAGETWSGAVPGNSE